MSETVANDPTGGAQSAGTEEKLGPSERALIMVQSTHAGASAIAAIFLSLYLFEEGGLRYIPLFYVADYVFQTVFFVISGYLLRRFHTNHLIRVGLLMSCLTYLVLLSLGHDAPNNVLLLGSMMGVADGLYWASINVTEWVYTHEDRRNAYLSRLFSSNAALQLVGPLTAGIVLTVVRHFNERSDGYRAVFVLLVAFWLTAAVFSRRIPQLGGAQYRFGRRGRNRSTAWRLVLAQNFVRGIWVEPLASLVAVLLLFIVNTPFSVTLVSVVTTLLIAGFSLLAGKQLQRQPQTFWIGALVVPVGLVGFGLADNWLGIVSYVVGIALADLFGNTAGFKAMYDVMDDENRPWQDAFDLIVQRESILNFGRIVGYGAIYVALTQSETIDVVRDALLIAAGLPFLAGLFQARINAGRKVADAH